MLSRDFDDHPALGMSIQLEEEGDDIGNVEQDVVAHDDVRARHRDTRKGAEHGLGQDTTTLTRLAERVEHVRILVHPDDPRRLGKQGEAGSPTPAPDVQDGAADGQRLASARMRGRVRGGLRGSEHRHGMAPGRLLGLREDLLRDGPGGEIPAPAVRELARAGAIHPQWGAHTPIVPHAETTMDRSSPPRQLPHAVPSAV